MRGKITKRTVDALRAGPVDIFFWDTETKGFGLKITPEDRRVYVLQYRMGGVGFPTRRYTIGKHGAFTPEQARVEAHALLQGIAKGLDPMATKRAGRENTIGALIIEFVESRRRKGKKSTNELARLLEREVASEWRHRPAPSINSADVIRLVESIRDRGSPGTANQTLIHLKTLFRWAIVRGAIAASPTIGVEMPAQQVNRDRTHTDGELKEIWQATESLGWPFGPALQLLALTGQRREEVGQMRWSEIDIPGRVWTIPANRTKNGQPHDVHLSEGAIEILRELPRRDKDGLIFTTTGETPISGWSKAKATLDRAIAKERLKTQRLPMPSWRIHDLRRTFATGLNNLGVLPHIADRILNHVAKSKGGVMAVYNRAEYASERRAAMILWSQYLSDLDKAMPHEQCHKI